MSKVRVGINGFGRIGRILFRAAFDQVEIVGINNSSGTPEEQAHLLKYDSTHGIYPKNITSDETSITVDGKKFRSPAKEILRTFLGKNGVWMWSLNARALSKILKRIKLTSMLAPKK